MNSFLQENLLAIIVFLLLIILLLIAIVAVILVKLLLLPKESQTLHSPKITKEDAPAIIPPVSEFKRLSEEYVQEKFFCENHPDTPSAGSCLICEDVFCENCLIEHEGMYFCKEHFKVFANNRWQQITDVKTTPNNPEDGLFIYHFKRHIWRENQTPSFVLTHYKINIEHDFIESFIQLNVVDSDADKLSNEIEKFKARHLN